MRESSLYGCFWPEIMAAAGEAVARPVGLAQARQLGARLDQLCEWSPRRPAPRF